MSTLGSLVVGWGLIAGMDWRLASLLVTAILQPWLVAALLMGLVLVDTRRVKRQRGGCSEEAHVLLGVASELRSGQGIRSAIAEAGRRTSRLDFRSVRRLVASGAPLERISDAVATAMPIHGALAAAALRVADRTGGRVAEVFDSAAALALEEDELHQERRAATAAGRASAVIVVGIPVLVVLYRMLSGDLARNLSASPISAFLTIFGVTLLSLGIVVMMVLIKRATP
jgi:Flp pilus assembly protein TadB